PVTNLCQSPEEPTGRRRKHARALELRPRPALEPQRRQIPVDSFPLSPAPARQKPSSPNLWQELPGYSLVLSSPRREMLYTQSQRRKQTCSQGSSSTAAPSNLSICIARAAGLRFTHRRSARRSRSRTASL